MNQAQGKHEPTREYSNGEVVIVWQSGLCVHSVVCRSHRRNGFVD